MQAVMQRAVAAGATHKFRWTDPAVGQRITHQLTAEFPGLAPADIARCVSDTGICAHHLGLTVTARLVERVAREHLLGLMNSVPPSGRPSLADQSG
jgi:hypothetical protein